MKCLIFGHIFRPTYIIASFDGRSKPYGLYCIRCGKKPKTKAGK